MWPPVPTSTADSKTLEHEWRRVYVGSPPSFGLGFQDGHVLTFWLLCKVLEPEMFSSELVPYRRGSRLHVDSAGLWAVIPAAEDRSYINHRALQIARALWQALPRQSTTHSVTVL